MITCWMMQIVKPFAILYLAVILLAGCVQGRQPEGNMESVDLLTVSEPSLHDFFKQVEVIQLEGRDSAYLNTSCLSRYLVVEDRIFVMDRANQAVVIFDASGKWKETFRRYGRGPQEYVMMTDIAFNAGLQSLDVLEATGTILSYSLDPPHPMIRKIKIPDGVRAVNHFLPSGSGYYLFSGYEESVLNYLDAESGTLTEVQGVPEVERNIRAGYETSGSPLYTFAGQVHYVDGASGRIFRLNGDQAVLHLGWDYGKYAFRPEVVEAERTAGPESYQTRLSASSSMAGPVSLTQETERFVFTNVLFMKRWLNVVYDKETGAKTVFEKWKEGQMFSPGYPADQALYLLVPPEVSGQVLPSGAEMPGENANYLVLKYVL